MTVHHPAGVMLAGQRDQLICRWEWAISAR
jgi:hypothetical protein